MRRAGLRRRPTTIRRRSVIHAFGDGYFVTGDLGKMDGDGLLYLAGRTDLLINRGGYKVDPREIEEVLETYPKIDEAVVVGVPTRYGDERIRAVIVASRGARRTRSSSIVGTNSRPSRCRELSSFGRASRR